MKLASKLTMLRKVKFKKKILSLVAHHSTEHDLNVLYLDSRVRNHMTSKKNLFTEFDEKVQGEISFGDLSKVSVRERDNILIK